MPTLLAFVSLLGGKPSDSIDKKHHSLDKDSPLQGRATVLSNDRKRPVEVHGVRLLELTERGSTVMKVSEVDEYSVLDPVINAFRVLGQLYNLAVSGEVAIVPESSYADTLVNKAVEESSDLLLLPWSETGGMSESQTVSSDSVRNKLTSDAYRAFVTTTIDNNPQCSTAVFVNKGFSGSLKQRPSALKRSMSALSIRSHRDQHTVMPNVDRSHHILMAFSGGADGRVALRLVLQLLENPEVTATIVHVQDEGHRSGNSGTSANVEQTVVMPKAAEAPRRRFEDDVIFFATMQKSVPTDMQARVLFDSVETSTPLQTIVAIAHEEVGVNPTNGGDVVVVSRSKTDGSSCLGDAADAVVASGVRASLLVVQARGSGLE